MRTIVAFLVLAIVGAAQNIDALEKRIAARPDNIPDRVALLNQLTNRPTGVSEARRIQILWLIEHHPEAGIYESAALLIPARGRLADPAGSAEAVALWKEIAARPGAKDEVVANAAIYLRTVDLPAARAILENRPENPVFSRARGLVDAAALLGLSGLGPGLQFGASPVRDSKKAFAEIDASENAYLIGKAGQTLARFPNISVSDDDALTIGERWLRRAIELAPPGDEWKPMLGQTLQDKANRTIDPKEKTRLFREAEPLVTEANRPNITASLLLAEFDSGDDAAAERDARPLVNAPKNPYVYMIAQTVLGRISAAKGDLNDAKTRLNASITPPLALKNAIFEPNMTLAQDIFDSGDRETVVKFLEASRNVWKSDRGRIDRMISFVKKAPTADLVQLSRQFPGNEVLRRPAPAFEATDLDGKTWTREQLSGKVVALEFGEAPLAEKVSKDFSSRGAVLLQIRNDDTKRRFEVLTEPTLVVIDKKGMVAAYHSGSATELEWRNDFEAGFGLGPNPVTLPAPKQMDTPTIAWEPVGEAESYVVEWDFNDGKGWNFDRDGTVRIIPTRETSATLDLKGFTKFRWRVFAVPRFGQPGQTSPWREIDTSAITKIYK